jgi:hypothetical protein
MMRRPLVASIFVLSFISLAAAQAQKQQILPLKPPPPAPIKPYTAIAATPPQPYSEPGFQDFQKQLAGIAAKKDRAALAKLKDGLEVRSAAKANAPVVEKLGLNLVRVLADTAPPSDANPPTFLHVATPSGQSGYIPIDSIAPLGGEEMCYTKDAAGWKITGYFGGSAQ